MPERKPRQRRDCQIIDLYPQPPATLPPHVAATGEASARRSVSTAPAGGGSCSAAALCACGCGKAINWQTSARSLSTNRSYATLECYARAELEPSPVPTLALAALRRIMPGRASALDARDAYHLLASVKDELQRFATMIDITVLAIEPEAASEWLRTWGPS